MLYFSCSDCFYGLIFAHKGGTQIPAMRSDIHEQSFCMSIVAQDICVEKSMRRRVFICARSQIVHVSVRFRRRYAECFIFHAVIAFMVLSLRTRVGLKSLPCVRTFMNNLSA